MSVVKVECHGCSAPYEVEERRIPATGLKMKCPKCGSSILVTKPGADASDLPVATKGGASGLGLPAAAAKRPGAPPAPRPGAVARPTAPAAPAVLAPRAPAVTATDLPVAAPKRPPPGKPPTRPAPAEATGGFGEIDLMVDLPAPTGFGRTSAPSNTGATGRTVDLAPELPSLPEIDAPDLPLPAPKKAPPKLARPAPAAASSSDFGAVDFGDPLGAAEVEATPIDEWEDLPQPVQPTGPHGARFGELEGFGDVDLPAIGTSRRSPSIPDDLPLVTGRNPNMSLPAALGQVTKPRAAAASFGEIDLPGAMTRPRPAVDEPDELPAFGRASQPSGGGFGEIDLPLVGVEDFPINAIGTSLPSLAGGSNLPEAQRYDAYPVPVGSALPVAAQGSALPVPAYGSALPTPAGSALPMAVSGSGLPAPAFGSALPMPAGGSALPSAAVGGGLPMTAAGGSLPSAVAGGSLPATAAVGYPQAAAFGGLPATQATGLPSSATAVGMPLASEAGLPSAFGVIDHGLAPNPYDDSDRTAQPGAPAVLGGAGVELDDDGPRSAIGDEADLGGAPQTAPRSAPAPTPAADGAPKRRSSALRAAIAAVVVIGIGGGALSLVPDIGPFGAHFISDKLNAERNAAALVALRQQVDAAFDADTADAANRAVDQAKQASAAIPRHKRTAAFSAWVAVARSLRFGKRGDDEAYAKQAAAVGEPSAEKTLADAALATFVDAGRGLVAARAAAQAAPADVDAAVLVGEAALAAKSKEAVDLWKKAIAIKSSPRTEYGLARAALEANDDATAKAAALKVIAAAPGHVGAHILVGRLLWTAGDEAGALEHLQKVTEDPKVRGTASPAGLVQAYTLLGRVHLARSRISAAEKAFGAALKLDPQAVEALIGNGELFYRAGRYSEALARFEAATHADAANVVAKVGVARASLALERMKEAKDLLVNLQKTNAKSALVALWLGKSDEALGNRKEAEVAYTTAIKSGETTPEVVDAYVALAHLLSTNGKTEEAAAKLQEASTKFPELPALHRAKGEVALQAGQYDDARKELEAALEKEDDLGTRFRLGVALRHLRRFEDAGKVFDVVSEADKEYPGLSLERGLLFQDMGQTDKALEMYDAALKKAPKDLDLKLRVGSTQVVAGHADQAETILREVIKERPNSAEVNHFLGRAILLRDGNKVEAQRFLQKAVDLDPNRAEYHLYLGWVANEGGNVGLAEVEIKKAIELDHDLGDAYWQRGVLLQKQAQTVDALVALNMALQKRPSRYEAYATMALCYQDQLRWPEAEDAWRKAIAGNDGIGEWHYRLGKILGTRGDKAAALVELEKSLAADTGQKTAPAWTVDAHLLLAEALRFSDKPKAIEHYKRFLALAPANNAYRVDAQRALKQLDPTPAP